MPGPEILALTLEGTTRVVAWVCEKCGHVLSNKPDHCSFCYKECSRCKKQLEHSSICTTCWQEEQEERAKARYDKAEKIFVSKYDGWLFDDDSEKFFESVEDLLDYFHEEGRRPSFAWACTRTDLHLDAQDILDNELTNFHEDAGDTISNTDGAMLQAYLDLWCKHVDIHSYFEDDSRVVLIDEAIIRKYEEENGPFEGNRVNEIANMRLDRIPE